MPRDAPVTSATFPLSLISFLLLLIVRHRSRGLLSEPTCEGVFCALPATIIPRIGRHESPTPSESATPAARPLPNRLGGARLGGMIIQGLRRWLVPWLGESLFRLGASRRALSPIHCLARRRVRGRVAVFVLRAKSSRSEVSLRVLVLAWDHLR